MSQRRQNSEGDGAGNTASCFNGPRSGRPCFVRNPARQRFLHAMDCTAARTQCARALGDDAIEVPNEAGTMDAARCRTAMAASLPLVRAGFEARVCATGAGAPAALGRGQVRRDEAQFFDAIPVECVSAWDTTPRNDASQQLTGPLSHLPEKTCKIAPIAPFIGAVWAMEHRYGSTL